jgi:hypothetical protein
MKTGAVTPPTLTQLWDHDRTCFYCGQPTWLYHREPHQPNDLRATRDHVFSRLDPRRFDKTNKYRHWVVLACQKCNQERASKEQSDVPNHVKRVKFKVRSGLQWEFVPHYPGQGVDKLRERGLIPS